MSLLEPTDLSQGEQVAWVTQGIILYVESDLRSIGPEVVAAAGLVLQKPWARGLMALRRWNEPSWQPWDGRQTPAFLQDLQQRGPQHPFWKVELADKPRFPDLSFDWQDLPPAQGKYPRASYLRIRLPFDTPVQELGSLAAELLDVLPVQQGRAGFQCHVDEANRKIGFDQAWAWARRYYGMDIVDPVEETWNAVTGVLGVSWLTLLGSRWLEGPLKDVDLAHVDPSVTVTHKKHGVLLQAGARPSVGDQNHFEDVSIYTEVSRIVEPALIESPTHFPGMFDDHESTGLWVRRFLDPTAWQDAS
jgi:hypothetical protein